MKLQGLLVILTCFVFRAYGQSDFQKISICHAKGKLSSLQVADYRVAFNAGILRSFSTVDGVVNYNEEAKELSVKEEKSDHLIRFTIVGEELLIKSPDTILRVSTQRSVSPSARETAEETVSIYTTGNFSCMLIFKNGFIRRIEFLNLDRYIILEVQRFASTLSLNVLIKKKKDVEFLYSHFTEKPQLLEVRDLGQKVGVVLRTKKDDGRFRLIDGLRILGTNRVQVDEAQKIRYSKKGNITSNSTDFNTVCK